MILAELCHVGEFQCGSGSCIDSSGECDGFGDCTINSRDEEICGMISKSFVNYTFMPRYGLILKNQLL